LPVNPSDARWADMFLAVGESPERGAATAETMVETDETDETDQTDGGNGKRRAAVPRQYFRRPFRPLGPFRLFSPPAEPSVFPNGEPHVSPGSIPGMDGA
jgi:hypothetical protein